MVRQDYQLSGHEFEQTLRHSEGQWSLQPMKLQRVRHDLAAEQHKQCNAFQLLEKGDSAFGDNMGKFGSYAK